MKKISILLLSSISLLFSFGNSENYFTEKEKQPKYFDLAFTSYTGVNDIVSSDGENFITATETGNDVVIRSIDKNGKMNFIVSLEDKLDRRLSLKNIFINKDNDIVVSGNFSESDSYNPWMCLVSKRGIKMGESYFQFDNGGFPYGIAQALNGDYLIPVSTSNNGNITSLMKVNKDGQKLWTLDFQHTSPKNIIAVEEDGVRNFLIVGTKYLIEQNKKIARQWAMKITDNGKVLWSQTFPDNANLSSGITLTSAIQDGSSLLLLGEITEKNYVANLIKIDLNGKVLFNKSYLTKEHFGKDLMKSSDGNYIIVGKMYKEKTASKPSHQEALMMKVSFDGQKLLWGYTYNCGTKDRVATSVNETIDQNLIVGGSCNQQFLFSKFSNDGNQ